MKRELNIAKNKPIVLVSLIIVVLAIISLQFIFPDNNQLYNVHSLRITNFWLDGIQVSRPWVVIAAIPFVIVNLFLTFQINSQFNIISNAYYFPSWLYLIISFNDYRLFHLSAELISSSFILISVYIFLMINQTSKKYKKLYWAGILLAIASLFSPQSILYIPLIFTGLTIFNELNLRNSLNLIIGILSVYFMGFTAYYLTDNLTIWHQYCTLSQTFSGLLIPEFTVMLLDFLLIFLSIVSLVFLSANSGFIKVIKRKHLIFFVVFLSIAVFAYVMDGFCLYNRFFLALPMSYIFVNYFVNTKIKYLPETLIWIVFIFFIISQSFSVFNSLSGNI